MTTKLSKMTMQKQVWLFIVYVRPLFLEITLSVNRHAGETLYNIEKLHSNPLKNYNINPGTEIVSLSPS